MRRKPDNPSSDQDVGANWLVCPQCNASLKNAKDGHIYCPQCCSKWPVIDSVPHFVQEFPYWGEIPLEQMLEVNRIAEANSWQHALLQSPEPSVRNAAGMILNLDRGNWHWLAGLPPHGRALDIGAGMGTNSHALAMYYREVVAVEPVLERVEFMRRRFSQEGLDNVRIVRSSVWTLPFQPQSFDLIAMNGVLEWVAQGRSEEPQQLQEQAIRRVYDLLRPGGCFYIGIENRWALGYFIGYPDPHCGLPFVTVLPRHVAHWYARKKGLEHGYRNYLYSSRGYRRLLRAAGFTHVEIYAALPSYNHPRFFVPLRNNIFNYYLRNFTAEPRSGARKLARELLLRTGILKYCEYSFVIIARK